MKAPHDEFGDAKKDPPVALVGAWKAVDQRGFSLENSSRTVPRNFTFARSRFGVRSALSRAHSRKRGDCVAWPILPCLRLPTPPRPCCMHQVNTAAKARRL